MGEPVWYAEKFIQAIDDLKIPLLWVPGNNDFGRAYHKVQAKYKSLEGEVVEMFGRKFTGVGGSPASWAGQYEGERSVDKKEIAGSIFLSHVPPPGLLTLLKYDDPREIPEKRFSDAPLIHICAHVHWQWGVGYLGQTKVIKLASAETGHYAILNLENLNVEFKEFPRRNQ
jgi:Icc-related predicted phosphoesterase